MGVRRKARKGSREARAGIKRRTRAQSKLPVAL